MPRADLPTSGEGGVMPRNATTYHDVRPEDQARITCQFGLSQCERPAVVCEHSTWNTGNTVGISFWYYCEAHDPRKKVEAA
jgi:hypothetical protein